MDEDIYENGIYCDICDNLYIVRFYKNHLKSQTHMNNIRKKKSISNIYTQIKICLRFVIVA